MSQFDCVCLLMLTSSSLIHNEYRETGARRVQALTAEVNMHTAHMEEQKAEIMRLRNEVYEWKKKYYDCHRKVTQFTKYVSVRILLSHERRSIEIMLLK